MFAKFSAPAANRQDGALGSLLSNYQQQYANAVAANRARYEQTLAAYQMREQDVLRDLDQMGQNQLRDLTDYYTQETARTQQSAISRGLSNTTISDSLRQGVGDRYRRDLTRLNNDIAVRRMQAIAGLRGDTLRYQGSYQDPVPSFSDMSSLAMAIERLAEERRQFDLNREDRNKPQWRWFPVSGGGGGGIQKAPPYEPYNDPMRDKESRRGNVYNYYYNDPPRGGWPAGLGVRQGAAGGSGGSRGSSGSGGGGPQILILNPPTGGTPIEDDWVPDYPYDLPMLPREFTIDGGRDYA
jgi:hypothetical protein